MDKNLKKIILIISFILIIFLLPNNKVYAEEETVNGKSYTYTTSDDGSSGVSLDSVEIKLTCYGDAAGGSGFFCGLSSANLAGYDEKYGWGYFEINGERYVAMAGALHDYIPSSEWGGSERAGRKYNHIYYFKTGYNTPLDNCEKIQFKFKDQNFDSNVYNGIIVDTGPAMMFPQNPRYSFYNDVENCNAIDVYMGPNGETTGANSPISGQIIYASSDGSFKTTESSEEDLTLLEKIVGNLAKFHIFLGDLIQKFLDKTGTDLTAQEAQRLLFDKNDLKSASNKFYKEIQVANPTETIKTKTLKNEAISNTIENQDGQKEEVFNEKTKIPVIPIDIYSIVATDIKLLDIDFLSNNKQNDNKLWNLYRNVVSVVSHSVLYICTALIIGIIIYRSILLVMSSYTSNPTVAEQSKKIINNLVKGVIYIVAVYLIIAIMINFYKLVISAITTDTASKYIIRFNVNQVYSFNTNIIGGARYLTQSTNIAMSYGWSWAYLAMAVFDLFCFLIMFVRTFLIGIFVITAPITAIVKINETDTQARRGLFYIGNWMKAFLIILWIPFLVAGLLSLLLHI